jgi:hypothetical protein
MIGEYLRDVRTLDRDDKRRALSFVQKSNQLISAIEVKDFALAEKLVTELSQTAKGLRRFQADGSHRDCQADLCCISPRLAMPR